MNRINCLIIILLLAIFIISFLPPTVFAQESEINHKIETRTDILPYPFSRGSAVWVAEQKSIFILGGRNDTAMLDRIMKYTPITNKLEFLSTRLPNVIMGTTSVYDGKHIYIFGGRDYDDFSDSILRFDPKTEILTNMTAKLPKPTVGAAGVWTGEYIYFFGGCWGGIEPQKFDNVLRYDPIKDNITVMNSKLTYGRSGLAATWDGNSIYIIGGSDGKEDSDEVFRYFPDNDTLITLPGKLPSGRLHIQAELHNGSLYIFGGRGAPTILYDQILRYDLESNEVKILKEKLPDPSEFRMHAYDGQNIYIVGGFNSTKADFNQFVIFTPDTQPADGASVYCPPDNQYSYVGIALAIIAFVVIMTLVDRYRRKKK